jgi:nucleotide-binding universal stress UspA family protein
MKILLATDGSPTAEAALELVLYRPWQEGAQVRVVSIVPPLHERINHIIGLFGLDKSASEAYKRLVQITGELVEKYALRLREKFGAAAVSTVVLQGRVKETLLDEATSWNADTIVLGSHCREETAELLFGSVQAYVLSHASCSVEILKAAAASAEGAEGAKKGAIAENRYLVALDDSACSQTTLDKILSRCWPPGACFKVMSVVEPLPFQAYAGLGPWEGAAAEEYVNLVNKTIEAEHAVARKVVGDAVSRLKEKFPHATVTGEVQEGYAKDRILATAKEWPADSIIMGSHGRSGFMEFVLGSVSKTTSFHAPCSVLVVRAAAPENNSP